jgi:hypothetical protein
MRPDAIIAVCHNCFYFENFNSFAKNNIKANIILGKNMAPMDAKEKAPWKLAASKGPCGDNMNQSKFILLEALRKRN